MQQTVYKITTMCTWDAFRSPFVFLAFYNSAILLVVRVRPRLAMLMKPSRAFPGTGSQVQPASKANSAEHINGYQIILVADSNRQ